MLKEILKEQEEEFKKRFPPVSQYSQRDGDYTEVPLPEIEYFIRSYNSKIIKAVCEEECVRRVKRSLKKKRA